MCDLRALESENGHGARPFGNHRRVPQCTPRPGLHVAPHQGNGLLLQSFQQPAQINHQTSEVMTNDDKIQILIQANPFVQMLAQLRDGAFITECTEKIGDTIAAVKRTGQKGRLTLTLTVEPDDKGEVRTVDISAEAVPKLPERRKKA